MAEDETELMMFPPLRAGWSRKGEPAEVHISGWNARRVIFGTMDLMTGTRLLLPRPKGRASDFRAFLKEIRGHDRGWHVARLLDGDPSHTARASVRAAEGMTLLGLPKRSPELNPMDTLWGQGKDVIAANKQDATIDEQVERFLSPLINLSGPEALHTSGVLSDDFWLRPILSKKFCGPA